MDRVVRIVDDYLTSLFEEEIDDGVVEIVENAFAEGFSFFAFGTGDEVVGGDLVGSSENFTSVVTEGKDSGFDSEPGEIALDCVGEMGLASSWEPDGCD
ncbi:hypothetical protein NDA11_007881 [Ustilago hordei]|nr:hypothetical protein NDA12_006355 [Ustilago hordei]KAJ1591287.1 hypothetical protein NDA11_007881 [Ustilago hordei]